jgi:hypothetical protein
VLEIEHKADKVIIGLHCVSYGLLVVMNCCYISFDVSLFLYVSFCLPVNLLLRLMLSREKQKEPRKLNNIRLSQSTVETLNTYIPNRRRSAFIRGALEKFLNLPKQNLMDRPRIRGSQVKYAQVPFLITEVQKSKIDLLYSDVSISVVVQNAIQNEITELSYTPIEQNKNMLTRIPESMVSILKLIASRPEYGSLRAMNVTLFTRFLTEKPYVHQKDFKWAKATRDRAGVNKQFNVLFQGNVSDSLIAKVKEESIRLEINLASFLYTALKWWVELHKMEVPKE